MTVCDTLSTAVAALDSSSSTLLCRRLKNSPTMRTAEITPPIVLVHACFSDACWEGGIRWPTLNPARQLAKKRNISQKMFRSAG